MTTPYATKGQFPTTVFFGSNIKNNIPEYIPEQSQETELHRKDRNDGENEK